MKLDFLHIGMATRNIPASVSLMKRTGACEILTEEINDPLQNCTLQMVKWNGITIELIAPSGEKNPVDNILKKGCNLYHICYGTDNLKEAIVLFKQHGWLEISSVKPTELFHMKCAVFMYHIHLGIVELVGE